MTKYLLILVLIFFSISTGFKEKPDKSILMNSVSFYLNKDTVKDDINIISSTEYFLKNGKSFVILLTPESDYLVNAYVFGKGFPASCDTILFDEIELIDTVLIADINNDGYEEMYIFTRGFFPRAYDHVFGVTSDEDKSYKEINFTPLKPSDVIKGGDFDGYQGQDVYTLENNTIKRTFPVYNAGDFYDHPSRGYRYLYYTLEKTDSGYFFRLKN